MNLQDNLNSRKVRPYVTGASGGGSSQPGQPARLLTRSRFKTETRKMARFSSTPIFLFVLVGLWGRGENLHLIVGDPVQFPDKCVPGESAELYRVEPEGVRPVAQREQGVCKPVDDYKDRMNENSCFAFSRSLFSDAGLYEISCGGQTHRVQLDVVFGSEVSVTEGEPLTVPCYKTCKQVDFVLWEKHGRVVVNHSLATGRTTYGTGFEGNVRLAPGGVKEGGRDRRQGGPCSREGQGDQERPGTGDQPPNAGYDTSRHRRE
uniref:uncharacterized protein LOC124054390 isoform X2 n=1 Tax=Scatophagus argus TaxID=75038 RepID=UPI001ED7CD5C|nr:uncharacterized protein LOC124054390 isoform X2 [Scatophagus argus]